MDLNPDIAFAVGYLKPKSVFGRFLTAVLRLSVRHSDFVVVLDRWMRQRMLAHGVSADRVIVVPPWPVNGQTPLHAEHGKRFRQAHGITQRFVLLYSGNHSIAHPLDTVLQTALEMRENPDVLFLFIGGGLREKDVFNFSAAHQLKNIRQLPYQPREKLVESLSAADLHLVVMGDRMSGLVHVSKIYGVLATGAPYVFIGPRASHIGDLQEECPYGFHVEPGDTRGLMEVIRHAQLLDGAAKETIFNENTAYVRKYCSVSHSLVSFSSRVLQKVDRLPDRAAGQFPSRA
jgi:glycosyltransferase involved in cell wall biosynthesis